jgi:hypothetical protein
MSYVVQSVLLNRDKFSKKEAFDWVREHGYKADKVDVTNEYYRFRQMNPDLLHLYYFRTIKLGDMGHLVVAYPGKE